MKELLTAENAVELTLRDVCERCAVTAEHVITLVDYGVVEPSGCNYAEWRFSARSYLQVRRALRLQRDLSINAAGVALALELLDQLQAAKEEVNYLRQRIRHDEIDY